MERKHFNRKRRLAEPMLPQSDLNDLATKVQYVGSPYHKRNQGDFGLTPPAQPRADKTLCDEAGIVSKAEAERYLVKGVQRGMVSSAGPDGFPKHVWAVTDGGVVLEAKYNNVGPGSYHGYPLFKPDPFRKAILDRW